MNYLFLRFEKFKAIFVVLAMVSSGSLFSSMAFAACPGYGGTITINTDNSTTNITSQISNAAQAAVADCASGSIINITSSGSLVNNPASTAFQYGLFLPPSGTGYLGDPTGVLNNEGSINMKNPIELQNVFGTINNGSSLGSTASITATGGIAVHTQAGLNALTLLRNYGSITSDYVLGAVYFQGSQVGAVDNYGRITGSVVGLNIFAPGGTQSTLNELNNYGTITSNGGSLGAVSVRNTVPGDGSIATINNYGSFVGNGGSYGIYSNGVIGTLNNLQGLGNSNGALTYRGVLPTNYNIVINSLSQFGQLSVTSASGSMAFGVAAGSTVNPNGRYLNVLQGFSSLSSVTGQTGTYNTYNYSLVADASTANSWDLCFGDCSVAPTPPGPSVADTQVSLQNTIGALQGIYTLQNSVLANSFSYDCNVFGENGVCVSAGGRNTAVSATNGLNNTSALLIAAYRPHPNYRIGAYVDQNLSVSNAGSTVNLGNNTPLIGLFGAWSENPDGTGTEVKVSAAYGQKNTTITRQVVGASEAGSGGSQLNSQGAQVAVKYGFTVTDNTTVSPYVGIRYTQNNMGGYTEAASSTVTAPLTYSALNTNATTALAGVGASYKGIPQTILFASAGVETDTNTNNGTYSATGLSGLTAINFNSNPVKTRPTAMLGAYYDVEKNQRLGVTGIYRQEAYQATASTTVMATYTVGL